MVITVMYSVSHTMTQLATILVAAVGRKYAMQDGLEPITPVVGLVPIMSMTACPVLTTTMVLTVMRIASHTMTQLATTHVIVTDRKYAVLDGQILTVCPVLSIIMAVTVTLTVGHATILAATTHVVVVERKYVLLDMPLLIARLVLPTTMAPTVEHFVSHAMIPQATTRVIVMEQ